MSETVPAVEVRPQAPLLIGAPELAAILGCSQAHVWRMHSAAKLPAPVSIGRLMKRRVQEVNDWILAGYPQRVKWAWPERGKP